MKELGISSLEDMGYDKPELVQKIDNFVSILFMLIFYLFQGLQSVYDM